MKYFGWVFLFFIVVYILPLGSRPLLTGNEYSFAESAREMVCSGDPVTATIRGTVRHDLTAPACYPAAKSIQLFGTNSFAVRFPAALAAGLTALFIWILINQTARDEKLAALASVIYLSFSAVYVSGTIALDSSLSAMLTVGACGCMFLALQEQKVNRRKLFNYILCGVFMGLGFLVCGMNAVIIPLLSGLLYMFWDRKIVQLPLMLLFTLLFAAAVAAPWLLAAERANPGFAGAFIKTSSIGQFWSKSGYFTPPWYFHLMIFAAGSFPAILLIPAAGVVGKAAWSEFLKNPLYRFAFSFLLLNLILYSFNKNWDFTPVLSAFAPLAVLIAAGIRAYFNSGCHHRSYNWMMTAWGGVLILAGIALAAVRFLCPAMLNEVALSPLFYPVTGGALIFAGGLMIYSITGNWRGRLYLFFAGIGVILLFLPWFFRPSCLMPGASLREIRYRTVPAGKYTIVTLSKNLADAAAWELQNSRIFTVSELAARPDKTASKVLMITSGKSACNCEILELTGNCKPSETVIQVEPLQVMMFDLLNQAKAK